MGRYLGRGILGTDTGEVDRVFRVSFRSDLLICLFTYRLLKTRLRRRGSPVTRDRIHTKEEGGSRGRKWLKRESEGINWCRRRGRPEDEEGVDDTTCGIKVRKGPSTGSESSFIGR